MQMFSDVIYRIFCFCVSFTLMESIAPSCQDYYNFWLDSLLTMWLFKNVGQIHPQQITLCSKKQSPLTSFIQSQHPSLPLACLPLMLPLLSEPLSWLGSSRHTNTLRFLEYTGILSSPSPLKDFPWIHPHSPFGVFLQSLTALPVFT